MKVHLPLRSHTEPHRATHRATHSHTPSTTDCPGTDCLVFGERVHCCSVEQCINQRGPLTHTREHALTCAPSVSHPRIPNSEFRIPNSEFRPPTHPPTHASQNPRIPESQNPRIPESQNRKNPKNPRIQTCKLADLHLATHKKAKCKNGITAGECEGASRRVSQNGVSQLRTHFVTYSTLPSWLEDWLEDWLAGLADWLAG